MSIGDALFWLAVEYCGLGFIIGLLLIGRIGPRRIKWHRLLITVALWPALLRGRTF